MSFLIASVKAFRSLGVLAICLLDITCDQFSLGGTGHIQTMQAWKVWEEGSYLPTGLGTNNVLGALGCTGGLIDVC